MGERFSGHAGEQALAALRPFGVDTMFTLNGGHVWPFYEAAAIRASASSTPATSRRPPSPPRPRPSCTRTPGVAVLTAGPGVTNGVSRHHHGPLQRVAAGGARRPGAPAPVGIGVAAGARPRPIVASVTKSAATVTDASKAATLVHEAAAPAVTPHRGPVFLDFPMDVMFAPGEADAPDPARPAVDEPDPDAVARAAALIAGGRAAGIIVGSDVYWDGRVGRAAPGGRGTGGAVFRQRDGSRLPAGGPSAGLHPHAWAAQDRGRCGRGHRHATRLPPGLRSLRRRPG